MDNFLDTYDRELDGLARRLKEARNLRNLTVEQAADEAHIDRSELLLYENAEMEPLSSTTRHLAIIYGVSMDWLAGMSEDPHVDGCEDERSAGPMNGRRDGEGEPARPVE